MTPRPLGVLRVKDLVASLRFYVEVMEMQPLEGADASGRDTVSLTTPAGQALLLAAAGADHAAWPADVPEWSPGRRVFLFGWDLDRLHERASRRGAAILRYREPRHAWDGWFLEVGDPDGYRIALWEEARLADEEVLGYFLAGPDRMRQAVAGLSDAQLDLSRAPGKWTIRQLVHHVVDSDSNSLRRLKAAIAEPGREFHDNPYDPDLWAARLRYERRPVEPELDLFAAGRRHVAGILRVAPEAWSHTLRSSSQGEVSVRQMMKMLMSHALEHIEQIRETRRVHGL
ncbi:MAG: DinB family protein [Firmicutes bacterium]|nr:DinB family protein [Bacillota bacterium]